MKTAEGKSVFSGPAALFIFLISLALATPATATTDLVEELPYTGDTVVVVDVTQMRDSPLYDQGFRMLNDHQSLGQFVDQLEGDFGFDVQNDIDAVVMTSESPPLNPQMLDQSDPAGTVETATSQQPEESLLLVRGDFETAEVLEKVADEMNTGVQSPSDEDSGYGKSVRTDRIEVYALGDGTLAIATASPERLPEIRSKIQDGSESLGQRFAQAIQQLGPSQGIYMMIDPTIEEADQLRTTATFAGLSLDLADQVRIGSLMTLEDDQSASRTLKEIDDIRRQADGNPMTRLLGVDPLLENLSIQQNGNELVLRSSMTNSEASRLVGQIGSILETERQIQQPLEGDGIDLGDSDDADERESDQNTTDDDGVDADFN